MIKAVIFDLDDTLISEYEYMKSGFEQVAKIIENTYKINRDLIYENLIKLQKISNRNTFNRLLDKYDINYDKKDIEKLILEYRNHYPNICFFSDVIPFIKFLKSKGIKIGIITDGHSVTQRNKIKALNAYKLFDKIIITDDLGKKYWKPNKKSYEIMKEDLNVKFDEMIYIGDNPCKDFYISSYYPIKCIRINRKNSIYKDEEYLNGCKEYLSIEKLEELYNYINLCEKNE